MRRTIGGFTLVELLVAVSIFAVMSVLSYGGVRHLLRLESGLMTAAGRYDRLEFAVIMLEQDINELRPRSVREGLGEREPALYAGLAGELLSLTRHVTPAPGTPGVALKRVRYRLEDGQLFRDVWSALDRTPGTPYATRRLLDHVRALRLRFHAGGAWQETWPPGETSANLDTLPEGVEFRIEFTDGLRVRRVLVRPG